MVKFLDPEIAKILQFLDPEVANMDKKILDPEIVEMVRFLDPEIVEKVDKSFMSLVIYININISFNISLILWWVKAGNIPHHAW